MCFRNIPEILEDFERKEKEWLGFRQALAAIGLDADKAKARLKQGKPFFENRKEQRMRCAKEWTEFKKIPGRVTTTSTSESYSATSAKSKPVKPG